MILSMPFNQNKLIEFDKSLEDFYFIKDSLKKHSGLFDKINKNNIAIYLENNKLILQINLKKWDISAENLNLKYYHVISKKKTIFELIQSDDIYSFEYDSWWSKIEEFIPYEPEIDEDEDFLAYIYTLWKDKSLQKILIETWSKID